MAARISNKMIYARTFTPSASSAATPAVAEAKVERKVEEKSEDGPEMSVVKFALTGILDAGKAVGSGKVMSLPPVIEATPRLSHRFRFGVAGTSTLSITLANLLGALGGICTVANSKVQPWASTVRIKGITIFPSSGTGVYTFINWSSGGSSGYVADTAKNVNIPDGVTVTKALSFRPPRYALASFWLNPVTLSTSAVIFGLTIHVGSILDLDVEYTLSNVVQPGNITVTSATLGNTYYLDLDGPSSHKLIPQGVPTTT